MNKNENIVYSGEVVELESLEEEVMTPESKLTKPSPSRKGMKGIDLLTEMYEIFSPSGAEHGMATYVSNWLSEHNLEHSFDSLGNIYTKNAIEGSRRILVNAHMDTVASAPAEIIVEKHKDDVIVRSSNNQVIGADDKNGVWSVLRLLSDKSVRVPISALICVSEEVGCVGSDFAMKNHAEWFKDCIFCVTIDRRGNTDIVIENMDIVLSSDTMQKQLAEWGKAFGLRTTEGSISDVSNIVKSLEINGINLFAGYYNAHSGREYTSMRDLAKSYKFQLELLPLIHSYLVSNPDKVKFTETTKSYSWAQTRYTGLDYSGFGYLPSSSKGVYSSCSDLDKEDIIDDFLELVDVLDRAGSSSFYNELMHIDMQVTKSMKSLRLCNIYATSPETVDGLSYFFTIRQDKNQDALLSVNEIQNFKVEPTEPLDWDSLDDNGGITD